MGLGQDGCFGCFKVSFGHLLAVRVEVLQFHDFFTIEIHNPNRVLFHLLRQGRVFGAQVVHDEELLVDGHAPTVSGSKQVGFGVLDHLLVVVFFWPLNDLAFV